MSTEKLLDVNTPDEEIGATDEKCGERDDAEYIYDGDTVHDVYSSLEWCYVFSWAITTIVLCGAIASAWKYSTIVINGPRIAFFHQILDCEKGDTSCISDVFIENDPKSYEWIQQPGHCARFEDTVNFITFGLLIFFGTFEFMNTWFRFQEYLTTEMSKMEEYGATDKTAREENEFYTKGFASKWSFICFKYLARPQGSDAICTFVLRPTFLALVGSFVVSACFQCQTYYILIQEVMQILPLRDNKLILK